MSQAERNRLSNKDISVCWRDGFRNDAVNRLHAEAFGHRLCNDDWWAPGQPTQPRLGMRQRIRGVDRICECRVGRGVARIHSRHHGSARLPAPGMMRLANETGLTREGLYKALSKDGNPSLGTVLKVVEALGLKLTLQVA